MQRNVTFLGIPVIRVKKTENYEKRYFLGVQYKVKKYARRYNLFPEAFQENVPFVHNKTIQVILNNLGEAVIYARTARFWHKRGALVFGNRPQHAEIFKMFGPEIPVFYCGEGDLLEPMHVGDNDFEAVMYDKKLIAINNEYKPFWQQWEKYLKADFSKLDIKPAIISEQDRRSAMGKLKALGVNVDNYVFFIPQARSCDALPITFWQNLETELKNKGYDVVYNSKIFSIAEAYAIAQESKAVIALRSGFNDILSEIKVPQHIIYSHNSWHGDLQPMYSLFDFPWAAKDFITEYNTLKENLTQISDTIIESMKG